MSLSKADQKVHMIKTILLCKIQLVQLALKGFVAVPEERAAMVQNMVHDILSWLYPGFVEVPCLNKLDSFLLA